MKRKTIQVLLIFFILLASCNLPSANKTESQNVVSPAPSLVSIVISNPAAGETFPALTPVPISVQVAGEVQSVELLVDGNVFESAKSPKHRKAKWDWSASTPGRHNLQAKAVDASGNTYTSNSISVWISTTTAQSTFLYTPQSGDTIDALAARFNTSPSQILQFNSFLGDGSAPLPLNQPLKILNVYPTQFLAQFPALEFKQTESDSSSSSSASFPQTHFEPDAQNPLNDISTSPDLVFADRVYYYMSLDGSPWSRFPRNQGEFVTPKNGFFDLDEILANLMASKPSKDLHVVVDAWGWQGGTLIYIGRFERIITANVNNEPWVILPGQLEICDGGTNCTQGEVRGSFVKNVKVNSGGMFTLRWHSPFGASDGLWQTSTQPFSGTCELEPAYLYTHGYVGSVGEGVNFEVEFPPYYGEPLLFYARVLPIVNGQPDCTSSNVVTLTLVDAEAIVIPNIPSPPAPPEAYDIVITDFKPIHFPDYTYRYCVTIVENPYYEPGYFLNTGDMTNVDKLQWAEVAPGTDVCPAPYIYEEPSTWDVIGDFLKGAVNVLSEVYNGLKNFVVDIIAEYNPICLQANLITESEAVKDACHAVAEIAVNAAMTYVGLPPSLPNYEELIETGKGQLTDLIAQQLEEQTGIPCPDECKELIRDGMEAALEEVQAAYADAGCMGETEAHSNGVEPLCLPDSIKVVPMHEGQLEPATIVVQITRRADVPDSAFPDAESYKTNCSVDIFSKAQNDSWIGQQVFLGNEYYSQDARYWQGESISGSPFKGVNSPMPTLAPGESTTLSFALKQSNGIFPPGQEGFWLPGRTAIYSDYHYNSQLASYNNEFQDDWKYLYFGSALKMTAEASCTTTFLSAPEGFPQGMPLGSLGSKSSVSDEWLEQIPSLGE